MNPVRQDTSQCQFKAPNVPSYDLNSDKFTNHKFVRQFVSLMCTLEYDWSTTLHFVALAL